MGRRLLDAGATTGPPARFLSAAAFDTARGGVILFGGSTPDAKHFLGDPSTWDGGAWHAR